MSFIEQPERATGFELDDPPEQKLGKLGALLSQANNEAAEVAPLIAALLSISAGTRYTPLALPAQRQRELTIAALVDQVGGLAARQPLLMVAEDSQWLDPTSTELFERLIERVQTWPVLLLITSHPEFAPPWTSYPHMTSLRLNRLGRRHSTEMIAAVADGKALPTRILDQIWAKTEGVPLFVEELTKTVLETGVLEDRGDRYELAGPLPPPLVARVFGCAAAILSSWENWPGFRPLVTVSVTSRAWQPWTLGNLRLSRFWPDRR